MSGIKPIEDRLKELLNYKESIGIGIKGEWGVGKTHFWKDFSKRFLQDKKVVYISLFGKGSLKELKEDMMVQISKFYEKAKKVSSTINTINLPLVSVNVSLESLLSILEPKNLNNVIVCFDEFERLSPRLELKEVFGFISYLKEHFNCKVVLIINEEEISRKNDNDREKQRSESKLFTEIYDKYKEKIIDYELSFTPSVEENFNIMKNRVQSVIAQKELHYFLTKFSIKNLRIIKQLILASNDFAFVNRLGINEEVKRDFFKKLIRLTFIKIKYNFNNFEGIRDYQISKFLDNKKENNEKREYEELLKYLDDVFLKFSSEDKDIKMIVNYLKDPVIDKQVISNVLKEIDSRLKLYKRRSQFDKYFYRLRFDFNYSIEDFKKNVKDFLDENKGNIIHIVGLRSFGSYIGYLTELDPENKNYYTNYAKDVLMQEITKNSLDIYDLQKSLERYPEDIKKVINSQIEKVVEGTIKNRMKKEILKQKMKDIRINTGWDPIDEKLLNAVSKDKYKKFMFEDMDFAQEVIYFYSFTKGSEYFGEFRNKIMGILNELENHEMYKIKVREIKRLLD